MVCSVLGVNEPVELQFHNKYIKCYGVAGGLSGKPLQTSVTQKPCVNIPEIRGYSHTV